MVALRSRNWTRVVATVGFDHALVAGIAIPVQPAAEPACATDARGRLRAERLARCFAPPEKDALTLVLTARDLCAGNCSWVFGYADRRRRVAIVSACRVAAAGDPSLTARRLRSVMAHELGHLHGLAHCPAADCVMHAARDASELDSRGERPCGRCPGRLRWWRLVLGMAACGLLFVGLDGAGSALKPDRMSPFSVRPAGAGRPARILFAGKPAIELIRPPADWRTIETQLNTAYRDTLPPRFEVQASPSGSALIRLNGAGLLEVSAAEAGGRSPAALAEKWSLRLAELVDGKGSAGESCPECHVARRAEVLAWPRLRGRR
jgi:predicted Zn-dependent protease